MTTPGYPFMDGPQQMDWPNAPEANENIPTGMGGMNWPDPGEGSMSMPSASIQDMNTPRTVLNTAQQNCQNELRATYPLPVDPDGDND